MADIAGVEKNTDTQGGRPPKELRLNTLSNARRSLTRIMRAYYDDLIPDAKAKTMNYLFQALLSYFKEEQNSELIERVKRLEEQLEVKS